jgi:predicted RNase H-like HicB family nuclease
MKTYIFTPTLERDEDGRWSAWISALPGCAAWGYTKEQALTAIKDAAEIYIADMVESGEPLPTEAVEIIEDTVAVTL